MVDNAFAFGEVCNESLNTPDIDAIRDANNFIHNAIKEIQRVGKKAYIMVEGYRNERELFKAPKENKIWF